MCVELARAQAALAFHRSLLLCARQPAIVRKTLMCALLNGVVFLGSLHLVRQVLLPNLAGATALLVDTSHPVVAGAVEFATDCAAVLFDALWFLPLYVVAAVASAVWYQDIAERAYRAHSALVPPEVKFSDVVASGIYRLIVGLVLLAQITLIQVVPVVGTPVAFCLYSLTYSFYAFEYVWALEGVHLKQRILKMEEQWLFFVGFGAPCASLSFFWSPFVNAGAFAVVFPMFILMATVAKRTTSRGLYRLRVFSIPSRVSTMLVSLFFSVPRS